MSGYLGNYKRIVCELVLCKTADSHHGYLYFNVLILHLTCPSLYMCLSKMFLSVFESMA